MRKILLAAVFVLAFWQDAMAGAFSQTPSLSALPSGGSATAAFCTGCANAALGGSVVGVSSAAVHTLYGFDGYNPNTIICYLQLFDVASGSVTLGTTPPKHSYPLLPTAAFDKLLVGDVGVAYGTQISAAMTTLPGNATACASTLTTMTFYFK